MKQISILLVVSLLISRNKSIVAARTTSFSKNGANDGKMDKQNIGVFNLAVQFNMAV